MQAEVDDVMPRTPRRHVLAVVAATSGAAYLASTASGSFISAPDSTVSQRQAVVAASPRGIPTGANKVPGPSTGMIAATAAVATTAVGVSSARKRSSRTSHGQCRQRLVLRAGASDVEDGVSASKNDFLASIKDSASNNGFLASIRKQYDETTASAQKQYDETTASAQKQYDETAANAAFLAKRSQEVPSEIGQQLTERTTAAVDRVSRIPGETAEFATSTSENIAEGVDRGVQGVQNVPGDIGRKLVQPFQPLIDVAPKLAAVPVNAAKALASKAETVGTDSGNLASGLGNLADVPSDLGRKLAMPFVSVSSAADTLLPTEAPVDVVQGSVQRLETGAKGIASLPGEIAGKLFSPFAVVFSGVAKAPEAVSVQAGKAADSAAATGKGLSNVATGVSRAANAVGDGAKAVGDGAKAVGDGVGAVVSFPGKVADGVSAQVARVDKSFDGVRNVAKGVSDTAEGIWNIPGKVGAGLKGIGDSVLDVGKAAGSAAEAVGSAASFVKDTVQGQKSKPSAPAPKATDKSEPEKKESVKS